MFIYNKTWKNMETAKADLPHVLALDGVQVATDTKVLDTLVTTDGCHDNPKIGLEAVILQVEGVQAGHTVDTRLQDLCTSGWEVVAAKVHLHRGDVFVARQA